jgi:4-diphosphocytidyl-2-C-methyl-D-erythritol kinase
MTMEAEGQVMRWPAPAKLNLFLHVLGQRPDGYHELQTLFQILDWGDEVHIQPTREQQIVRVKASYEVAETEDLAIRAAQRLQAASGSNNGARIEVIKRIPMGAGLGGGSSDAATVLLVLNRLWGCGLTRAELASLGVELGADVPVFINGHSALATGIGERLKNVALGERHYLLVVPDFAVSTRQVFSDPALKRDSGLLGIEEATAGGGRNDCEPVVMGIRPHYADVMRELRQWGEPKMTGTGSGIFLRMRDEESAINAASDLKCRYNVRAVRGVDLSPLHAMLDSGMPGGQKKITGT